jgi:hypothetical protein
MSLDKDKERMQDEVYLVLTSASPIVCVGTPLATTIEQAMESSIVWRSYMIELHRSGKNY